MMALRKNLAKSSMAFILSMILLVLSIVSFQNGDIFLNTSTVIKPPAHKMQTLQGEYTLIEEEDADEFYSLADFYQLLFVYEDNTHFIIPNPFINIKYRNPFIYSSYKYKKILIPIRS